MNYENLSGRASYIEKRSRRHITYSTIIAFRNILRNNNALRFTLKIQTSRAIIRRRTLVDENLSSTGPNAAILAECEPCTRCLLPRVCGFAFIRKLDVITMRPNKSRLFLRYDNNTNNTIIINNRINSKPL